MLKKIVEWVIDALFEISDPDIIYGVQVGIGALIGLALWGLLVAAINHIS